MIVDTHCHLDDVRFDEDLPEVIERAKAQGVGAFIIPGADIRTLEKAQTIAHTYDEVFYAAGVHPYDLEGYDEEILRNHLRDPKCVAVGECGLDYYRLSDDDQERAEQIEAQKRVFSAQITLAKEVGKPLIVHIREASADAMAILIAHEASRVGGVLHCYNADRILLGLVDHGFYYGIGGVLTFKNAKQLPRILPEIPKERLLVETDAPYLTPHPYRGKRNEPAFTRLVVQKMAELLEIEEMMLEEQIAHNTLRLFQSLTGIIASQKVTAMA